MPVATCYFSALGLGRPRRRGLCLAVVGGLTAASDSHHLFFSVGVVLVGEAMPSAFVTIPVRLWFGAEEAGVGGGNVICCASR